MSDTKKGPMTYSVMGPEFFLERARGVEPPSKAWEAFILPMNYARAQLTIILYFHKDFYPKAKKLQKRFLDTIQQHPTSISPAIK